MLPKLLYNELERGFSVPYRDLPIGDAWRPMPRTTIDDAWWALWVAGLVVGQGAGLAVGPEGSDEQFAIALSINGLALLLIAAAGVALFTVIRRLAIASTQ